MVMAFEIPVRDQPVASDIGCRNTASQNTVPMASHPISAPAATTIQPYWSFTTGSSQVVGLYLT
jgi:hypothetical protein